MKVRIGYGLGTRTTSDGARLAELADALEDLRFDSLWLSERLTSEAPDPLMALAFVAARTRRLKLGTSVVVVPGRNPVVLAKQMASLDRLSNGRFLPAVGLGAPVPAEHRAFGVERHQRASLFDEALTVIRRLWTEDDVNHDGQWFSLRGVTLQPKPVQQHLDVWLGGRAPGELRRVGRHGDGWLASFMTSSEIEAGWQAINETAEAEGRAMDPEHLGVLIAYSHVALPGGLGRLLGPRGAALDAEALVPVGLAALRAHIEAHVAVGASKFVVVPLVEPTVWDRELAAVSDALADLQT